MIFGEGAEIDASLGLPHGGAVQLAGTEMTKPAHPSTSSGRTGFEFFFGGPAVVPGRRALVELPYFFSMLPVSSGMLPSDCEPSKPLRV